MQSFNPSKIELSIKDSTKGQKIAAALYLVTAHLSDTDPLKTTLRTQAITLNDTSLTLSIASVAERITDMLTIAVLAGLISEKNASIIILELRHFTTGTLTQDDATTDALHAHFGQTADRYAPSLTAPKKTISAPSAIGQTPAFSLSRHTQGTPQPTSKTVRQEQILSLINERKSAGIKDIALLFPDTSEKTIQRELGTLVANGRITKRGAKRWSVYMAI